MAKTPELRRGERRALLVLAVLAVVLAFAAIPRLIAGTLLALAPGVHSDGLYPQPEEWAATEEFLARAEAWQASTEIGRYRALVRHLAKAPDERAGLEKLLAQAPLLPEQWLWLGQILARTDPAQAIAAWRMSVYNARVYPSIMESRLDLGLELKPEMGAEDQGLLDDQFRLSYVVRPAQVQQILAQQRNLIHRGYFARVVKNLSDADMDAIMRIHVLH
ncbi:hypothetical protein [Magnetospirillum gryphiswaldense]|uniref:Uncharacterized protein n=1 Tax=Magnetospirillum gryphiswaldense (strain DSM 6361 / JCM 21280 / NBRC 15271 / MSR-1) TaxID=431944 RepID=V6F020_MAGGM|nr:hypothetical protein [Magnetospirillum gryphiswaldense]AVM73176.1 hypothetical protein MSR1_06680 [Magnetospirillum gryphiswaldense MSR-1]AVM77079.1 hypothetical protein MSR1L_06680 [Magnetospirillum gryphiswaldense]CDK97823.1 exported protein of unknown function [Magnetospirillum gryphiswaldense MSR-1 v2]